MMLHVIEVAGGQRAKRHRVMAADYKLVRQHVVRHGLHDVQQVAVEQQPQVHQIAPRLGRVALAGNPELLLVIGELQARNELRAHETLMIVARRVDQVAEDLFLRPARRIGLGRGIGLGDVGQSMRRPDEHRLEARDGLLHFRTTLTVPVLFALSAARITSRCSPGARPARSSENFSRGESITPSTDSIGTQVFASSEYSQRRSGLVASAASHSMCAFAPSRRVTPTVRTGGVLSIITGELTSVASRADAGGLLSRSLAITRKKYFP